MCPCLAAAAVAVRQVLTSSRPDGEPHESLLQAVEEAFGGAKEASLERMQAALKLLAYPVMSTAL